MRKKHYHQYHYHVTISWFYSEYYKVCHSVERYKEYILGITRYFTGILLSALRIGDEVLLSYKNKTTDVLY